MKYLNPLIKLSLGGVVLLMSSPIMAAISASAHDFSTASWNTKGEICSVCHTPHNAGTSVLAPMWDRTTSTAAFTLYLSSSSTSQATLQQPTGLSLLCLSCHDGTIALDNSSVGDATKMTGTKLLGTDLRNDHPISFTYDDALVAADTLAGGTAGLKAKADVTAYLFNNSVECASCHDVHNSATIAYLLRETNAASALCLQCHIK
ncbi:MAG: cytochrome c3 family protein [Gammaproteobacteria bacterium]|nr:cytochrome c3 family protein [Gammaproteobacteria bacterium]